MFEDGTLRDAADYDVDVLANTVTFTSGVPAEGTPVTVEISTTSVTNGGAVISGTPDQSVLGSSTVKWTQAAFIFDSPLSGSETLVLRLDGNIYTVSGDDIGDDIEALTQMLSDLIISGATTTDKDFSPVISGTTVTFKSGWPTDDQGIDILPDVGDE